MITTLNNLAMYSSLYLSLKIGWLLDSTKLSPPESNSYLKDRMSEIQDIILNVKTTEAMMFALAPIEVPKAAEIFADAKPYREADTAKIIERGIKYNSVVDQGRYDAAVARLETMQDKCSRLIEWHTYLKEQVLV